jgi:hypothetical protein
MVAIVVAMVVLALIAAGITVLSQQAHLAPGSFYAATPTAKVANDGYSNTKYVVDGNAGGVLHISVRNSSRIPVTILGLSTVPETPSILRTIAFEPDLDRPGNGISSPQPLVSQVTLGHDEEAGILLTVRFPDCVSYLKGSNNIYDFVPVKVRRLGVTRTAEIRLELPLWVSATADHPATGTCAPHQ